MTRANAIPATIRCSGCDRETDPDLCDICGDGKHGADRGHAFVAAGCICRKLTSRAGRYVRDVGKRGPWAT